MLAFLLSVAMPILPQAAATAAKPATGAQTTSIFTMVANRMSAPGRSVFTQYIDRTLLPQVRAEAQAEAAYRQQLRTLVAAPTLDVDAAQRLIDQRKRAEATTTGTIRSSAFAMIKSLPAADRKLALTAIFADARLIRPATAAPAPAATAPAKPTKTR